MAPLIRELSDDATSKRFGEVTLALLQQRGVEIEANKSGFVRIQYVLHGLDAGKAAFFSIFTDDTYVLSFYWHNFKRAPWAEEMRADPEVAAVMAARELRIAEIREQVLEIMEEPEWQL